MSETKVRPFLMFDGHAEEAMNFYMSLFPGSQVLDLTHYGPEGPGAEGSVMKASFTLDGQVVMCTDSTARHDFTFTPSLSFFISCDSEDEIRRLSSGLASGGAELMPLGNYGFSRQFAWVTDRFGVSWQLNLD
ncbi:MAG TPA: VOC family protein [Bryobacteraceae bacterium]|nr:VOC family protein [Bryobacteraceae bacterium]